MDDLIDRQSVVDIAMSYCPDDDGCCSKAFNDIRELLDDIENLPAVNQWIPCSERLPENETDVLVYHPSWKNKPIQVAHLQYDGILFELSDREFNFGTNAVTHWMPLPKPPVGGNIE